MVSFVSPGVIIREWDLTAAVGPQSQSIGALAGVFRWGPCEKRVLVDTEPNLWAQFGKPTNLNAETFFTAANFLSYSNALQIVRAANTNGTSPIINATANAGNATVTTTNTSSLSAGMIMIATNNTSYFTVGGTIASIINSTAFNLSSGSYALANGTASVQFVSNACVYTAVANVGTVSNLASQLVKNEDDFTGKDGTFDSNVLFVARYPGAMGNSLRVSVCDSANAYTSTINLSSVGNGGATVALSTGSNTATVTVIYNHDGTSQNNARQACNTAANNLLVQINVTDYLQFGNTTDGTQSLKVTSVSAYTSNVNSTIAAATFTISFDNTLRLMANQSLANTITRYWEFYTAIGRSPGQSDYVRMNGNTSANDELHIVVVDDGGLFTGVPGTPLKTYSSLSRATDARGLDNTTNYWKTVINTSDPYIWAVNDRSAGWSNTALNLSSTSNASPMSLTFKYGQDGSDETAVSLGVLANAWDFFNSAEVVDVELLMQGKARGGMNGEQLGNYLIDNIAETRQDCVVFISPEKTDVVNQRNLEKDNIVAFRNGLRASSYGILDSGYKYQYDRYNDLYRWIPLNGDIAGLCARTDELRDPWWSPAGYNRGQIKNVVRLAWNPTKAFRDELYKKDCNPVITDPGHGTLLFGDKTLLGKESAFNRIGVRRLFITIEKEIGIMAKQFLFEINDDFTRALFRNTIVPYLQQIKHRRGIYDFQVVCDSTNNPGTLIDLGIMTCDIYVKPARSINWIVLNFVAVRTGDSFNSVVGQFGG